MDTNNSRLRSILTSSRFRIHAGRFVVLQLTEIPQTNSFFMLTRDDDEVTAVVEENDISGIVYQSREEWFKLVEIRVSVPFYAVGFLATIASAIAQNSISLLIVSTFSKDYLLIREQHIDEVSNVIRALGLTLEPK